MDFSPATTAVSACSDLGRVPAPTSILGNSVVMSLIDSAAQAYGMQFSLPAALLAECASKRHSLLDIINFNYRYDAVKANFFENLVYIFTPKNYL